MPGELNRVGFEKIPVSGIGVDACQSSVLSCNVYMLECPYVHIWPIKVVMSWHSSNIAMPPSQLGAFLGLVPQREWVGSGGSRQTFLATSLKLL